MTLREDLTALTPRLRRYARALAAGAAGPSAIADDIVHATLMRALGARQTGAAADLAIRLYATVTQLHREVALAGREARAAGNGRPSPVASSSNFPSAARNTRISAALLSLPIEDREALLLVALEGFDHGEAARILRISRGVLIGRLTSARTALDMHLRAPAAASPRARSVPHLRLVT